MRLETKLHGFEELHRTLKTLPERTRKNVVGRAAVKAMRAARNQIKSATPTHLDRQSPASKKYGTGRSNIRLIRLKYPINNSFGARIDTGNAFWLFIYELGSRFQPARAFFASTFRAAGSTTLSTLGEEIGNGIDKEFMKDLKR